MLVLDALGIGPGDEVVCPVVHVLCHRRGDRPSRRDTRVRRHRPGDAERRPRRRRAPHHASARRRSCRCTCSVALRPDLSAFGLPVIEDAAQAFGAEGIATSVVSTFSFFPTKNLFALGDGGLIGVNDAELAQRAAHAALPRLRGEEGVPLRRLQLAPRRDAGRVPAHLPAAPRRLEPSSGATRRPATASCSTGLVETPLDEEGHVYHMYCVRSPERDRARRGAAGAPRSASRVYYQPPLHLQPALALPRLRRGRLPGDREGRRARISACRSGPGSREEQQAEVVSVLKRASDLVRS